MNIPCDHSSTITFMIIGHVPFDHSIDGSAVVHRIWLDHSVPSSLLVIEVKVQHPQISAVVSNVASHMALIERTCGSC